MARAIHSRRRGIVSMERHRRRQWGAIRVMGMAEVGMDSSRMVMEALVRVAGELVSEERSLFHCFSGYASAMQLLLDHVAGLQQHTHRQL